MVDYQGKYFLLSTCRNFFYYENYQERLTNKNLFVLIQVYITYFSPRRFISEQIYHPQN